MVFVVMVCALSVHTFSRPTVAVDVINVDADTVLLAEKLFAINVPLNIVE